MIAGGRDVVTLVVDDAIRAGRDDVIGRVFWVADNMTREGGGQQCQATKEGSE
jgi:hypothetical protein